MFNIGFAELILVLLIAFLVVGPRDLPRVARWLGRLVKKSRQLIRELKQELGWDDLVSEADSVKKDIADTAREADITTELQSASKEFQKSMQEAKKETGIKKP